MKNKTETTLKELLELPEIKSDSGLCDLIESLLKDTSKINLIKPVLEKHLDIESLLNINKDDISPDLDNLRRFLRRIEEKIEAVLEKLLSLLKELKKKHKKSKKLDPQLRKLLLKLIFSLINLISLKNLIERLIGENEEQEQA
ncbi:hypothetical protein QA612_15190 [Evansella sp. AB-P1]|uniref:hypothetical protein n=1 Tax=Evansella sp. AB-P1 TaxID=3037653 RepID=UPI00241E63F6|nr:hypothetical protein [Evansella sp. AB-P1]MDG5788815.1 hypothetical protein [Evansella sp. AB-P1]